MPQGPAFARQGVAHGRLVGVGPVLAELVLAFQCFNGEFEADNGAQQTVDIALRRVADGPRLRTRRFMRNGGRGDVSAQPVRIFDPAYRPPRMYRNVIPSRHRLARFGF